MKKKKRISLLWAILMVANIAPIATSCTDDRTPNTNTTRVPIDVTAGITTRATNTTWQANDAIGVFTLATGTNTPTENKANRKYINQSAEGNTATFAPADAANTAYYPIDGSEVDVMAYYPFANGELKIENGELAVDVTTQTNLAAIDLMTAERVVGKSKDDTTVPLVFAHRLTKLNIALAKGDGANDLNLEQASVTLLETPATAVYNLFTQSFTSYGKATDITLKGNTAIVVPTAAGKGVSFKVEVGDKSFQAALPNNVALGSGEVVSIKITLTQSQTAADITATIKPWTSGPEQNLTAVSVKVSDNPETGTPEVTNFTLIKNGKQQVEYTYTAGQWSTGNQEPFYMEDIQAGDKFVARHTPTTADAITGVYDVLETGESTIKDGAIALAFAHKNAKVSVVLKKGEGFPAGIDISAAQVTFLTHTFTGAKSFIVEAGTIAAGQQFAKIVVGSNSYEVTATSKIELPANSQTVITLKLMPTTPSFSTTLANWNDEVNVDIDTKLNITSSINFSGLPASEIKISTGTRTATYTWSGSAITASTTPIYWEDLDKATTHQFSFRLVPADAGTPEKDILTGQSESQPWGAEIAFSIRHENARFTINLMKDDSYTDEEFDEVLASAVLTIKGLATADYKATVATPCIFAPQAITAAHKVELTVDQNVYTLPLLDKFAGNEFKGNEQYTLNATLHKTGVGISIGNISNWNDPISGSGDFEF